MTADTAHVFILCETNCRVQTRGAAKQSVPVCVTLQGVTFRGLGLFGVRLSAQVSQRVTPRPVYRLLSEAVSIRMAAARTCAGLSCHHSTAGYLRSSPKLPVVRVLRARRGSHSHYADTLLNS